MTGGILARVAAMDEDLFCMMAVPCGWVCIYRPSLTQHNHHSIFISSLSKPAGYMQRAIIRLPSGKFLSPLNPHPQQLQQLFSATYIQAVSSPTLQLPLLTPPSPPQFYELDATIGYGSAESVLPLPGKSGPPPRIFEIMSTCLVLRGSRALPSSLGVFLSCRVSPLLQVTFDSTHYPR